MLDTTPPADHEPTTAHEPALDRPALLHREGVDGSSPEEGLQKRRKSALFRKCSVPAGGLMRRVWSWLWSFRAQKCQWGRQGPALARRMGGHGALRGGGDLCAGPRAGSRRVDRVVGATGDAGCPAREAR